MLVLLAEDLVLAGRLLVVTADHKLFTGGRLRVSQGNLCDLLQAHANG